VTACPIGELELLPIQFIKAPQENDTIEATLTEALDAITAGALLAVTEHEATIATLTEERDRLRTVVSAFPETSSGDTASAAEPG
jgi:uncharacterized small protein (DUF1192 family)